MRPRIPTNRKNVKSLASARQQSQGLGGYVLNLIMSYKRISTQMTKYIRIEYDYITINIYPILVTTEI